MENGNFNDKLELFGRRKLAMTMVESVNGFSEQALLLTVSGTKVKISGEKIKITSYNKATGTFTADGEFSDIKYGVKKTPLFKRIFK
ncbi:MAG: YabP/YqfC family sporulation protein [Clostridia bacterium]|nr:YabP/YqfC family sporulation protein [Clostridia bacterium]